MQSSIIQYPLEYSEFILEKRKTEKSNGLGMTWFISEPVHFTIDWEKETDALPNAKYHQVRLPVMTHDETHIDVSQATKESMLKILGKYKINKVNHIYSTFINSQIESRQDLQDIWKLYWKDAKVRKRLISIRDFKKRQQKNFNQALVIHKGKNDLFVLKNIDIICHYSIDIAYLNPIFSRLIGSAKLEPTYLAIRHYLIKLGWTDVENLLDLMISDKNKAHHPAYDAMMTLGLAIGLSYTNYNSFLQIIQ